MAFSVSPDREVPDATLVVEYAVNRLGQDANLKVVFAEVVYDTEEPVAVDEFVDADSDGSFEVLVVSGWAGRTDLLGKEVFDTNKTSLGTVEAFTDTSTLEDGSVVPPQVTLSTPLASNAPLSITLRKHMTGINVPSYRVARGGRRWEVRFGTGFPSGAALVTQLMGAAYFNAARAVLDQFGVSYTQESLVAALGATGANIDSFIAEQGEVVEEQRRAGLLPWIGLLGDAPVPQG